MCYCSNKLTNKNIVDNRFSMFCERNKKNLITCCREIRKKIIFDRNFPRSLLYWKFVNVTIVLIGLFSSHHNLNIEN